MNNVIDLIQSQQDHRLEALERLKAGVEKLKVAMKHQNDFQAIAALEEIDANYTLIARSRP